MTDAVLDRRATGLAESQLARLLNSHDGSVFADDV